VIGPTIEARPDPRAKRDRTDERQNQTDQRQFRKC
jgi:hypothetical protein